MKSIKVCVVALACVGGAFAFGVVANAAIEYVVSPRESAAEASARAAFAKMAPAAEPSETAPAAGFALASATSTPVDLGPAKVKTIPMMYVEEPAAEPAPRRQAAVPLPRPRPETAPTATHTGSLARQPGTMAIAAATKQPVEDTEILSEGQIDRMKTALALTAEQEEFWPAIASELRAIGKQFPRQKGRKSNAPINITVDADTKQRLYWAAAPLITRLSYEQKLKAKQMARMMGLTEVAEAL